MFLKQINIFVYKPNIIKNRIKITIFNIANILNIKWK